VPGSANLALLSAYRSSWHQQFSTMALPAKHRKAVPPHRDAPAYLPRIFSIEGQASGALDCGVTCRPRGVRPCGAEGGAPVRC